MKQIICIFSCALLLISCGTQQKMVENTEKEITPEINSAIIDSVNAQHDNIAPSDQLNNTKTQQLDVSNKNPTFTHENWNELVQKYVSDSGNVNYSGLKNDRDQLRTYLEKISENKPTSDWSKEEKLAFWINAYNAMTVDLILRSYPAVKGIKNIRNPWKQRLWKIGDKWYNLDEIEHDILRKMDEPRIHFAINCASFSCPPLLNEAFTAEKLETQLTNVTKEFLADSKRNTITKKQLEISKIFKWFSKDFKQNGSLIDFLNQYSPVQIDTDADISYKEYNWDLNE